jgi:hypothetical protein
MVFAEPSGVQEDPLHAELLAWTWRAAAPGLALA